MRSKNKDKVRIDYDLNIYQHEHWDEVSKSGYYLLYDWRCHVYIYENNMHHEFGEPFQLSVEDIEALRLNDPRVWESDSWYWLEGFMRDYWSVMSDKLKRTLEGLPRYREELVNV